jgi:hypothetical protein
MRALIGHTGFVGGNLLRQTHFDATYHSANIDEIRGRQFDMIVCAGAPAEKWKANADPERDRATIARLVSALREVRTERMSVISTVDVYPVPRDVDESTIIDAGRLSAYGRHRLDLEEFCRNAFETYVVRLPALFGLGLKKNAIYDLLHDHEVEKIDVRGVFQFYDLTWLWRDLERCVEAGLHLVNIATTPLAIANIARDFFRRDLQAGSTAHPPHYDVKSLHGSLWGRDDGYLYGCAEIEAALRQFVEAHR